MSSVCCRNIGTSTINPNMTVAVGRFLAAAVIVVTVTLKQCACGLTSASIDFTSPLYINYSRSTNNSLLITCNYVLQGDKLYSLQIFRNGCEFYNYLPGTKSPVKIYDCPGVTIDKNYESKNNQVMIKNVGIKSSDIYECEVSTDFPNFLTKHVTKQLNVVVKPKAEPNISIEKDLYNLGDILEANCTSEPSYPEQQLIWVVNGAPLSEVYYNNETIGTPGDPYLRSTISRMGFTVARSHFGIKGQLTIQCVSNIGQFYQEAIAQSVTLNTTNIQLPDDTGALHTNDNRNYQTRPEVSSYLMMMFVSIFIFIDLKSSIFFVT